MSQYCRVVACVILLSVIFSLSPYTYLAVLFCDHHDVPRLLFITLFSSHTSLVHLRYSLPLSPRRGHVDIASYHEIICVCNCLSVPLPIQDLVETWSYNTRTFSHPPLSRGALNVRAYSVFFFLLLFACCSLSMYCTTLFSRQCHLLHFFSSDSAGQLTSWNVRHTSSSLSTSWSRDNI